MHDAKKLDELESYDDDTVIAAMSVLHSMIADTIIKLAGRPLGFALVVSDGHEVAVATNVAHDLAIRLLDLGHRSALRRERDGDAPP